MSLFHNNNTRHITKVTLRVIDINKSIEFYSRVLGFEVIEKDEESVTLGIGNNPLLKLKQAKTKKQIRTAGLYHIAYLLPKREDLANWLYFHLENNTRIDGASNHYVSEAVYLSDIDRNGIEIYVDTPKESWVWDDGNVEMVTKRLDIESLFREVSKPTSKLPKGTIIGHIHLSVLDINKSREFYNILGFNTVLDMSSAVFLSDNNYHHHIGLNIWNSFNGIPHNDDQADIASFTIKYPGMEDLNEILLKLKNAGFSYIDINGKYIVRDVNNIEVNLEY